MPFILNANRPPLSRRWRVIVLGVILAAVGIPSLLVLTSGGVGAGGPPIQGRVFQDFDSDGTLDLTADANNPAIDQGVGGVEVRAFDATGANVTVGGFTTTDATGVYTLSTSDAGTGPYRIEFSNLPAGFQPSARAGDSMAGSGVGSSVQFASAGATGVDFAVSRPSQYCQANPNVVVPCYLTGDQTSHTTLAAFIRFPYTGSGNPGNPAPAQMAVAADIGTTYGVAWQRTTQNLYMGAFVKRGTGLGPLGGEQTGTIYRLINPNTSPTVTVFTTVSNTGANPHPNSTTDWDRDPATFDAVGKMGLADLEISENEQFLFAINLNTRQLVRIDASTPSSPGLETTFAIPNPCGDGNLASTTIIPGSGAGADWRPFGLGRRGNTLYVGGVCSGETQTASDIAARQLAGTWPMTVTTNGAAIDNNPVFNYPGAMVDPDGAGPLAAVARDLRAVVYEFDITTGVFSPTPVLNFSLGYERTCVDRPPSENCRNGLAHAEWKPWINVFPYSNTTSIDLAYYPQPMLSDIEFDNDGTMIVGFRDRWGDQGGAATFSPIDPSDPTEYDHRVGGDVLRACLTGVNQWTIENNAARCDGSGATGGALGANPPAETRSGPGNGEYYFNERYDLATGNDHQETSLGSLGLLPGGTQVLVTVMDSFDIFDNGVAWMNNTSGARDKAYQVYRAPDVFNVPPLLGKANGLGDIELLCDAAPVEIGNRVWNDLNANGIQDPNEPGIGGVTVQLYDASGALLDTVVTDVNGEWYFSSATGTNTGNSHYSVPLQVGATYSIRLDNPTNYQAGNPLNGLFPTRADSDSQTGNNAIQDVRDSDATPVTNPVGSAAGTWPVISHTIGGAGQNNHGLDFGFNNINYSLGNRVWYDVNNNGQIELGTEAGIDNVTLNLYADTNGDGTPDNLATPVSTTTTANGGYYRFDSLPAGLYVVCIAPNNFAPGGALRSYSNAGPTENTAEGGADNNDNGLDQASPAANCILSSTVRLGPAPGNSNNDTEPSGESDLVPGPNPQGPVIDARADMTVDFGFYRLAVGNRLWFDTNNDGIFNAGESPVGAGITVQLCNSSGAVIASTTTDASGNYLFDQVTVGPNAGAGLPAGDYYVCIPPNQFQTGGLLAGYNNSAATETDPDANLDENGAVGDNGLPENSPAVNGIRSGLVTLTPNTTGAAGNNTVTITNATTYNPTVDFGFFRLSVGNTLWFDTDNDGVMDGGEAPVPAGIAVNLYDSNGNLIATTTTDSSGNYLFTQVTVGPNAGAGLPPGNYYIQIPPSEFQTGRPLANHYSSGPTELDPNQNGDQGGGSNPGDNGINDFNPATNGIRSNTFALTPGATGAAGNNTVNNNTGTTNNPTIDFGFQTTPTAIELGWFRIVAIEGPRVTLNWLTLSEVDNFGFVIYRSPTSDFSQAEAVGFVNATNLPGGALYAFTDETPAISAWYYWLADMDTQGNETLHEPVSISPDIISTLLPYKVYTPHIQR